jgi:hypothetical protein
MEYMLKYMYDEFAVGSIVCKRVHVAFREKTHETKERAWIEDVNEVRGWHTRHNRRQRAGNRVLHVS